MSFQGRAIETRSSIMMASAPRRRRSFFRFNRKEMRLLSRIAAVLLGTELDVFPGTGHRNAILDYDGLCPAPAQVFLQGQPQRNEALVANRRRLARHRARCLSRDGPSKRDPRL